MQGEKAREQEPFHKIWKKGGGGLALKIHVDMFFSKELSVSNTFHASLLERGILHDFLKRQKGIIIILACGPLYSKFLDQNMHQISMKNFRII